MFLRVSTVLPEDMEDNIRELPHRAMVKNERHGIAFKVNRKIMPSAATMGIQGEPKSINLGTLKNLTVAHCLTQRGKQSTILRHYHRLENCRGDWEDYGFLLLDLKYDSLPSLSIFFPLWACADDKLTVQVNGDPRVIGRAVCPGDCNPPRYFPYPFDHRVSPTKEQIQRGFVDMFHDASNVVRALRRTIEEDIRSVETNEWEWYRLMLPILRRTNLGKLLRDLGIEEPLSF